MSTARTPDGTRPMRFAYADPPYPGQAKRWYGNHPDYAGEVDHGELVARLCRDYPDGWALSTSQAALRDVLILCPPDVRTAVWHVTNAEHPGARADWWLAWEPVIVRGGRRRPVRNVLACSNHSGYDRRRKIAGQKPPEFSRWVFGLLGAEPGDELTDIFPGSGVVAGEWESYCASPGLVEPLGSWRSGKDRRSWRQDEVLL